MSDFEDNNPFSGTDRRLSSSSGLTSNFAPLSINNPNAIGPGPNSLRPEAEYGINGATSSAILDDENDTEILGSLGFRTVDNDDTATTDSNPRVYSSRVELILYTDPDVTISIVEAGKSREGSSRGFISYTIKIKDLAVRRRYSEFESLRNTLVQLFPTLIIPPIPEKHTMCK